jgi:hypothetical protein
LIGNFALPWNASADVIMQPQLFSFSDTVGEGTTVPNTLTFD